MLARRQFLKSALAGGAVLVFGKNLRAQAAAECKVEILLEEPIGTISPDLYGHFTEHIGGVIYDGIWVGENSKIPNINGIRKELVEYMKRIKPSVVRWPGGCFADSYNWRDGIGPRSKRPQRPNFWINTDFMQRAPDGPSKYESNEFGTHEFVQFCRLIGAQPYLAANVGSATPREFYEWVEYCNAPAGTTTLAEERAGNGSKDPFKVRYWGVGNESWGCGGNFTPEEYAEQFRKFTTAVPAFGVPLAFIGSGPSDFDVNWTTKFFTRLTERSRWYLNSMYGWSMHYYCGSAGRGQAVDFNEAEWYELLARAVKMDPLIQTQWDAMGQIDTDHRIKLIVDEWGTWHREGSEVHSTHLFGQTGTMRDALVAGLTLDIFNRHADKVTMANIAQLINNLQSLFLAHEDQFIVTPNFHVFEMYVPHSNGQSVRTVFTAPEVNFTKTDNNPDKLSGLAGSASLHGKQLIVTAVNPSITETRETEIMARGAKIKAAAATVLSEKDIHARNSFENPEAVRVKKAEVRIAGDNALFTFPPASAVQLTMELG